MATKVQIIPLKLVCGVSTMSMVLPSPYYEEVEFHHICSTIPPVLSILWSGSHVGERVKTVDSKEE